MRGTTNPRSSLSLVSLLCKFWLSALLVGNLYYAPTVRHLRHSPPLSVVCNFLDNFLEKTYLAIDLPDLKMSLNPSAIYQEKYVLQC